MGTSPRYGQGVSATANPRRGQELVVVEVDPGDAGCERHVVPGTEVLPDEWDRADMRRELVGQVPAPAAGRQRAPVEGVPGPELALELRLPGPQTGLVPVLLTTEPDYLRFEDGLVNDPFDRPMLR